MKKIFCKILAHESVICLMLELLSVNYRGSLGYGQDSIFSLPGNIGTQDVKDVQVKTAMYIASDDDDYYYNGYC